MSETVENRFPFWKCVLDGKQPLSEVRKWDLEDIDTFCNLLDMRQDYQILYADYQHKESQKK